MAWGTFFFGVYCTLGTIAVWKLLGWHLEANRMESARGDYIDAEFYIVE